MRSLIEACERVVVMDEAETELTGASILVEDGAISWVGSGEPPDRPDRRLDARGCIALPGFVNAHHHLFQVLTRVRAQEKGLFGWLVELFPLWARLDADWTGAAARAGLAELALSGCTTTADHHYVFPAGGNALLEAEVEAAREVGLRFHPCRGSMDMGRSAGGLPPDSLVEDTDGILAASEEAIGGFHDPTPASMLRIGLGPCTPFTASELLMRESAELARRHGVRLHSHIAETVDEEQYCLERFGMRPVDLFEAYGWLASDVWLAHGVHLTEEDLRRLADRSTGIASCPTSNLRLASGIAPLPSMLDHGVPVGLGVDGSASNDSNHILAEARLAMLVARAGGNPESLTARETLRIATRGGARLLGREDEIGSLEPGKRADIALFSVEGVEFAGADSDLVAALLFCAPRRTSHLMVEGNLVVENGHLVAADEEEIARRARAVARRIVQTG